MKCLSSTFQEQKAISYKWRLLSAKAHRKPGNALSAKALREKHHPLFHKRTVISASKAHMAVPGIFPCKTHLLPLFPYGPIFCVSRLWVVFGRWSQTNREEIEFIVVFGSDIRWTPFFVPCARHKYSTSRCARKRSGVKPWSRSSK